MCFSSNSIEVCWTCFKDLLLTAADQSIPKTVFLPNQKRPTWLSDDTIKILTKKRGAYRKSKRTKSPKHIDQYKAISKKAKFMNQADNRMHIEDISNSFYTTPKRFWNWITKMQGSSRQIPDLLYQGKSMSSATDKCNALNHYFTSVFTKERSNRHRRLKSTLDFVNPSISSIGIGEADTLNALREIDPSKSCGPDGIPGRLLREGASHLSEPLKKLFNMTIQQGTLPIDWKTSKFNIAPLHKKGSRNSPSNYRPISLTSIVVKMLEKIIYSEVYKHLSDDNILSPNQHGFRARHSCQTQLLESINDWAKTIDKSSTTHVIFLDFSKAFDTVSHQCLLLKLECCGIRGWNGFKPSWQKESKEYGMTTVPQIGQMFHREFPRNRSLVHYYLLMT